MIERTPEAEERHKQFLKDCKDSLEIFEYGRKYGINQTVDFMQKNTDGATLFEYPIGKTQLESWGLGSNQYSPCKGREE